MKIDNQRHIIILGSPNSGISLLGRILEMLGINKLEYGISSCKEKQNSTVINNNLYRALGIEPIAADSLPRGWNTSEAAEKAKVEIKELLLEKTGQQTFYTGDPLICHLLPLWLEVFSELGINPSILQILRHPWEVARSLKRTANIEEGQGCRIWLKAYRLSAKARLDYSGHLVIFEDLVVKPVETLKSINKVLNFQLDYDLESFYPAGLAKLIQPGLRNYNAVKMTLQDKHRYSPYIRVYQRHYDNGSGGTALVDLCCPQPEAAERDITFLVRTIHHLSCTGGTIICKCLAAMHDTVLLSEMHPVNPGYVGFGPFDPLQQFQVFYPDIKYQSIEELKRIYLERLERVVARCRDHSKALILRDHSHTDYLSNGVSRYNYLLDTVAEKYNIKPVVTIRNPIDAYLSLLINVNEKGWHTDVKNFDEYCSRFLQFVGRYEFADIYLYENFIQNPDQVLKQICKSLIISYNPDYKKIFPHVVITGDSGRGKELNEIKVFPRRDVSEQLAAEIETSENFNIISKRFGYQ